MSEIPFQFLNRRSSVTGYQPAATGLLSGELYIQQADKKIFFTDDNSNLVTVLGDLNTGNFAAASKTGSFIAKNNCCSVIVGGVGNQFSAGFGDSVAAGNSSIVAGDLNYISTNVRSSVVLGGCGAYSADNTGTAIVAGYGNSIGSYASYGAIVGGMGNNLLNCACASVIIGGCNNNLNLSSKNTAIIGGFQNCIERSTGSAIIGGCRNKFCGGNSNNSIILGGVSITGTESNTVYLNNLCVVDGTIYGNGSGLTNLATGNFVTTDQTGSFGGGNVDLSSYVTTGQTGVFALAADTGSFVTTSQTGVFASLNGSNYLTSTQIPNITGDICINAGSNISTLCKIRGYPVSTNPPSIGQTLQFDGTYWAPGALPAGGNGGGGLVYYFNDTIAADAPTTNLPASLSGTFELGRTGVATQYSITSSDLTSSYSAIIGFVTDVLDPDATSIQAGIFDFNLWVSSTSATANNLQAKIYKYNNSTTTATLLATSDDFITYGNTVITQYTISTTLPQTTILTSDRLFILLSAKSSGSNKTVTLYFGGNTPSHVHTTIPSIGGSGIVKVINGVMQNPASEITDSDISASAAIAGTKIQTNYFALVSATGSFLTNQYNQSLILSAVSGNVNNTCYSAILGGSRNTLCSGVVNSVILGGCFITGSASNTVYTNTIVAACTVTSTNFAAPLICTDINTANSNGGSCGSLIISSRGSTIASLQCGIILNASSSCICPSAHGSMILGGSCNCIDLNKWNSAIIQGCRNLISAGCSIILAGSGITASVAFTAYANNFCAYNGKYYGDGSALTGIAGATTSVSTVTGTNYSISSSNYNNIIRYSGGAIENSGLFTLPSGIAGFTVGGSVMVVQVASGQAYFTGAAGTTVLVNGSKSKTSACGATMTFTYTATNEWLVNGDII